ncbi:peptidase s41 family protein [Stemphylium lycopersici]|uniref:Peptidase s41 family protein n=1 Tax=Stemphylium lycopersici TaxID=183478 RepID=A0A364NFI6_STELY|nr:peptidase s41 family protein [Stemphylium lycopersici]RAR16085.1 peptidase s41 family protein [Stemphylium lycopersici]
MKTFAALSTLAAVVTAQTTSFAFGNTESIGLEPTQVPTLTSIGEIDVEPTAVESISGPIVTSEACGQVASLVQDDDTEFPVVPAELAYACLKSLPFYSSDASVTVDEIKKIVEFQSTLAYLKDPPEGWPNPVVDIIAGLDNIKNGVESGDYDNEYDFENDIAALLVKAHDGHLGWNGMAYAGAFAWRRGSSFALISASTDGSEIPQVWALQDFNNTNGAYDPSPVTKLDGKDVLDFLKEEADLTAYHDPDTRFNAMFFMQSADSYGSFTNPRFYPGATTNITYENGTTDEYRNAAIVLQPTTWNYIEDAETFYQQYCIPETANVGRASDKGEKKKGGAKKRDINAPPLHLENPRDHNFQGAFAQQHGSVPLLYPEPAVQHSGDLVPLAGYFINTGAGEIGVLIAQTFNTPDTAGAQEFQEVIEEYISQAKSRGVEKHIIDIRGNPGGKILSGYDMYLQFFPSQVPQVQSRYRGHAASEVYGESISSYEELTLSNGQLFTSPFSNDAYLSSDLEEFPDWKAMYPPRRFKDDKFTALLKYNLSDPLTTSNEFLAVGITMTGYNERSSFTEDPFRAEDIIILSDGICASTCSIFLELMVQQSGVRTLAIGGRPQLGPMVSVGGTKGTLVLPSAYMEALSLYMAVEFAESNDERTEWAEFLPQTAPIAALDATVNFQDNIRAGLEAAGMPTQFLNDTASCRVWYEPEDYLNVTRLWDKVAGVAFGNGGKLDESACVAGSVTNREQQTGRGESNPPTTGDGGGNGDGDGDEDDEDAASGLRVAWTSMVVCASAVALSLLLM